MIGTETDKTDYTELSNEQIAQMVQQSGDADGTLRLRLLQMNQGFITSIWRQHFFASVPYEELRSIAYIAVDEACKVYQSNKGTFLTVLQWSVLKELSLAASNNAVVRLPREIMRDLRVFKETVELFDEEGNEASEAVLSSLTGYSVSHIRELQTAYSMLYQKSLDAPLQTMDEPEEITLSDMVADNGSDIEAQVIDRHYRSELATFVSSLLAELPENEQVCLTLKFYQAKTPSVIADELNITPKQVQRLTNSGLRKLRKSDRLKSFFDNENMYVGCGSRRFRETFDSSVEKTALRLFEVMRG